MDSATPLTVEEKEAILKMAGVLIRTKTKGVFWSARKDGKTYVGITRDRDTIIEKAFNVLMREQTK